MLRRAGGGAIAEALELPHSGNGLCLTVWIVGYTHITKHALQQRDPSFQETGSSFSAVGVPDQTSPGLEGQGLRVGVMYRTGVSHWNQALECIIGFRVYTLRFPTAVLQGFSWDGQDILDTLA